MQTRAATAESTADEVYAVCLDTTEFCCIFVTADCVVVTAGNGFGCVVSISCYDYGKKNEDCRQTFVAVQFDADKHNHCGNDDTSCDIAVKIALLISVFLCFNSFPDNGSDITYTAQDAGCKSGSITRYVIVKQCDIFIRHRGDCEAIQYEESDTTP